MKIHKFIQFYILFSVAQYICDFHLKNIFKTLFLKDRHCNSYKPFLLVCVDSKFTSFTFTILQASKHFTKTEKFLLLPKL